MKIKKNSGYRIKLKNLFISILILIVKILDNLQVFSDLKRIIIKNTMDSAWKLTYLHRFLNFRNKKKFIIHCIGDSHASFFSGYDQIQSGWPKKSTDKYAFLKSYRLGPVLAYNLGSFKTRSRGREKLLYLLNHILPFKSKVLFCFGEIDCRAHLLKQAEIQKRDIHHVVKDCVDRYFSVIKETKNKGFELLVWNVIPSGIVDKAIEIEYPFYGTNIERNEVSKYFNLYLKQRLDEINITFINIFDKLVIGNNETDRNYFFDGVHISQRVMPFFFNAIFKKYPISYRRRKKVKD